MGLPNIRWLLALITALHRFVYRVTGGWIGGGAFGKQFLLLSHTGRLSGQERITPLLYVADGERWVVAASNAGDDRPPAWWLNLSARPEARIQVGRERVDVVASLAQEPDSERLWSLLMESYAAFDRYRNHTPREIPLVVLERRRSVVEPGGGPREV
jgi:deazaflavin-dependent oxidoreductase (nitroreductase family)